MAEKVRISGTPGRLAIFKSPHKIGNAMDSESIITVTGNYTASVNDSTILCDASSAAFTVTLPSASDVKTKKFNIKKIDSSANAVTLDGNGATIDGDATADITSQYENWPIQSDGSNYHVL